MLFRLACVLAAVSGLLLMPGSYCRCADAPRPTLEAKDIESQLRTDWFGLYLQGKKIGYVRTSLERSGDYVLDTESLNLKLSSFGKKSDISINQVITFDGKAPYGMVKAELIESNDASKSDKTLLVRKEKGYEYTFRTGMEGSKKQIDGLDYTLADSLAPDLWIRGGPKVGEKANFKQLDIKDAKINGLFSKVLSIKTSPVAGVNLRYYEIENESSKEKLKFLTRHDDQGRVLSNVIAIFELRLESEEQAKNTEYSQDLFVMGMVKCDRPLGATDKVKELVIQVEGKEAESFEDGPRQSIVPGPNGSRLLKLGKKYGKDRPATKEEIAENLKETNAYAINHPKVKALAEKAVGDAKTPEEKVRRIVHFVHDFVQPTYSATIPTIHDLMEKKRGDCKSYALLVTNLARASGVPARDVSGLVYMSDDQKAFGGHAWNEVVLNGVWVPVDASRDEMEVNATHLSYGTEFQAAKNMLNTLGKLSFKIIEVK
jgi:hypothetical protein